jgi:hypothetical protein
MRNKTTARRLTDQQSASHTAGIAFFKYRLDAAIDPLEADIKRLIDYLVLHEGISTRQKGSE